MSDGLDLDSLRGRWAAQGRAIDAGLGFDADAVRRQLLGQRRHARVRHGVGLGLALAFDAALLAALAWFGWAHRGEPTWWLMALALAAPLVAHVVAGVQQLRWLRTLDLAGPVPDALATMARLRDLRLRLSRLIVVLSVVLWWPMLLVALHALTGIDPLRWLHGSVLVGSVLGGVLFAGAGWALMAWLGRRYGARAGMRAFLDDVAGTGWRRLRDGIVAGERFEARLAAGGEEAVPSPPPASARPALAALRRRLWLGILGGAAGVLAIAVFNATHGGQAQYIVPGVLVNLLFVAQMAFSIENRAALARSRDDRRRLQAVLLRIADQREALARWTLALSPVWVPAALQVLAKVMAGIDLQALTSFSLVSLAYLFVVPALLAVLRRNRIRWPARWLARMAFGVPARARAAEAAVRGGD